MNILERIFETNPLTKTAFICITFGYLISIFYSDVAIVEVTAYVFIFTFFALVLRAETLGVIAKDLAEALKEKWNK